jgi:FAD/FMN-containing dehydrogenase
MIETNLNAIVGEENVITDPKDLEKYSKDQSFVPPKMPLFAVRVKNKEEIRRIIIFANQYKIPVTPYSSGTTFQGAHIPTIPGITIDLSQMNQIYDIDYDARFAIIEPGVTFKQLQDEAKKKGLRVMTCVGVPDYGSVVATYLERTPLYSWPKYGGLWELVNFEVVLPTGDIVAFGPLRLSWVKKPVIDTGTGMGLTRIWCSAQGTMGIAVKGVVFLNTLHDTIQKVFFIPCGRLRTALELLDRIQRIEVGEECFIANKLYLAAWLAERWPKDFESMREALPDWTIVLVARGWKEQVEYQEEDLKDVASKLKAEPETELPGMKDAGSKVLKELEYPRGILNLNRYKGVCNPLPVYTPLANVRALDRAVGDVAEKHNYPEDDIGFFILPIERGQAIYYEPSFYRDPNNPEDTERVRKLWCEVGEEMLNKGAYYERPYGPLADMTYTRAVTYRAILKRIKKIVDPNNIMNPGKLTF